ncbi:MAG: tartrate dehydrogenase [Chloroflexi bacterium]|nr:tartrate dehydrogenase [Chloroflexota bacterium]
MSTRRYSVAVIPGDGIGQEVIPEGVATLQLAAELHGGFTFDLTSYPWGCRYYLEHGRMMPPDGMRRLRDHEVIYFGACGWPAEVPDHISLWGLILPIRKEFDQYVNLRPARLLPGVRGPLRDKRPADVDFVCVRENTEGEYAGVGGRVHVGTAHEVAIQSAVFSRFATERIIRYAFDLARTRPRKRVLSVTKSNAQQYSAVFWDEVFAQVSRDYPDVTATQGLVDAVAAAFVTKPEALDVVVASNLFADILTDLGGALMGSLGLPPSANIDPERRFPSLFEPVHGSAPDIAGKGIANPIATIWSGAMMLEFLGEAEAARALLAAIDAVTANGTARTPDLGGTATTADVGAAIRSALAAQAR